MGGQKTGLGRERCGIEERGERGEGLGESIRELKVKVGPEIQVDVSLGARTGNGNGNGNGTKDLSMLSCPLDCSSSHLAR